MYHARIHQKNFVNVSPQNVQECKLQLADGKLFRSASFSLQTANCSGVQASACRRQTVQECKLQLADGKLFRSASFSLQTAN